MLLIDIDELQEIDEVRHGKSTVVKVRCQVTVRYESRGRACKILGSRTSTISSGFSSLDVQEIRWYLERYIQEPLRAERATKALESLYRHGQDLISSLNLGSFLAGSPVGEEFAALRIRSSPGTRSCPLFWELLENKDLWPKDAAPKSVMVIRLSTLPGTAPLLKISHPRDQKSRFNILLISARPDAGDDLPPRLVSRMMNGVLEMIPPNSDFQATIEMVRPATEQSLIEHLESESRPPGYFSLVHFDVHGVEDISGRVYLRFIQTSSGEATPRVVPHDIEASVIGNLLSRKKISYAVLNACRSAKGNDVDSNIALALLASGLLGSIAMSFNFAGGSAQVFTRAFYEALLLSRLPFPQAAMLGRQALRQALYRGSRFGGKVEFDDSMVPIVYLDGHAELCLDEQQEMSIGSPPDARIELPYPLGREDDMTKVESILLVERKPVFISGDAAVGKSALVDELSKWWKQTGLFHEVHVVQISTVVSWDLRNVLKNVSEKHYPNSSYSGLPDLMEKLAHDKVLLIFDGLDAITVPGKKFTRQQRRDLLEMVQSAARCSLPLILTSRAPENWLLHLVNNYQLTGLSLLSGCQLIRHIISRIQETTGQAAASQYDTIQDQDFLEHLVKLADGNPMAIKIFAECLAIEYQAASDFYLDVAKANALALNVSNRGGNSHRVINELQDLIKTTKSEAGFADDGGSAELLALFSRQVIEEDLPVFAWYCAQSSHSDDVKLATWDPKIKLSSLRSSPDVVRYRPACERVISLFKERLYLREIDPSELHPSLRSRRYFSIHPLVPIIIRNSQDYQVSRQDLVRGFYAYITKRLQEWPVTYEGANINRDALRQEADDDFFNFASAVVIFIFECDSLIKFFRFVTILPSLSQCSANDPSRERVLVVLWKLVLLVLRKTERELSSPNLSERPGCDGLKPVSWSIGTPATPTKTQELKELGLDEPAVLCLVQYHIHFFAILVVGHHHWVNDDAKLGYLALAEGAAANVSKARISEHLMPEMMRAQLKYNLLSSRYICDRVQVSAEAVLESRKEYCSMLDSIYGKEVKSDQKGPMNLLVNQMGPDVLHFKVIERFGQFKDAVWQGKYDEAQGVIEEGLLEEINEGGNNPMIKARLLRLLAKIKEAQGDIFDAASHTQEAKELEEAAGSTGLSRGLAMLDMTIPHIRSDPN